MLGVVLTSLLSEGSYVRNRSFGLGPAVVLAAIVFGCGSDNSKNTFTCNYAASAGVCADFTSSQSLSSAQQSQIQTACTTTNPPGTFSSGATCPTANRVGTCTVNNSGVQGVT